MIHPQEPGPLAGCCSSMSAHWRGALCDWLPFKLWLPLLLLLPYPRCCCCPDSLYVEKVDVGEEEPRTIVSG
jgi:hypothetical protein